MKIPVYTPNKISEKDFLNTIQEIQPDLCITAAYGNYLPLKFLQIPKYGTVNIHPSLLPKYRGASPVQRSLVNGDHMVGVTVLYTVKEMDAGPIITQSSLQLEVIYSIEFHSISPLPLSNLSGREMKSR
jgi:methionyl-tRNA formyltransferase